MNKDLQIKQLERNLRITRDRLQRTKKHNAQALSWLRTSYHNKAVSELEKGQAV